MRDVHPVDLFFALTDRGTPLPPSLGEIYGTHRPPRSQGWALEEFANGGFSLAGDTCSYADWIAFSEALLDYGYPDWQLSKDNGPSTQALLWDGMQGWGTQYRRLRGQKQGLSRFALSVQGCQKVSRYREEPPQVFAEIHHPGGGWTLVVSVALWNVGDVVNYHYAPVQTGHSAQFDVRLRVSFASAMDLFNLGVTWDEPAGLAGE